MSFVLQQLHSKEEVDSAILGTPDKVLVLRFGRVTDPGCMVVDDMLEKCEPLLARMARICLVDVDEVPTYTHYFDVTYMPSTVFFFNAVHMKLNISGAADNTKFVGVFKDKQDVIDLVEVVYRGALHGKFIVDCPMDATHVPRHDVLYNEG